MSNGSREQMKMTAGLDLGDKYSYLCLIDTVSGEVDERHLGSEDHPEQIGDAACGEVAEALYRGEQAKGRPTVLLRGEGGYCRLLGRLNAADAYSRHHERGCRQSERADKPTAGRRAEMHGYRPAGGLQRRASLRCW
jgi:hypothetical protein